MANNNFGLKLKPMSVKVTFIAFALFLLFAALASFNVIDLTDNFDVILGVTAVIVIFTEVGLSAAFKSRGRSLDVLGLIGLIAGIITLTTVALEFVEINALSNVLNPIQGLVFGVLVVSFMIEAFRN